MKSNAPNPKGGEARPFAPNKGRMPKQSTQAPVKHTKLDTGNDFSGLGKMPKNSSGRTSVEPVKR